MLGRCHQVLSHHHVYRFSFSHNFLTSKQHIIRSRTPIACDKFLMPDSPSGKAQGCNMSKMTSGRGDDICIDNGQGMHAATTTTTPNLHKRKRDPKATATFAASKPPYKKRRGRPPKNLNKTQQVAIAVVIEVGEVGAGRNGAGEDGTGDTGADTETINTELKIAESEPTNYPSRTSTDRTSNAKTNYNRASRDGSKWATSKLLGHHISVRAD